MRYTKDIKTESMNTTNMNLKAYIAISISLVVLVCMPGIASATTHPCLLFGNISETPGYQHRTESPWSGWEASIISSADIALGKDFSDSNWPSGNNIRQRAYYARDLAFAYQITNSMTYADKAKESLLNLDVGDVRAGPLAGKFDRYTAARHYSLAYDWTQPYLDSASDETIRDKLALLADDVYYDLNDGGTNMGHIAFADHHSQAYPIMGIVGCVLYDYTNPNNLPLNSTPSDWIKVGTEYLFENDLLHSHPNRSLLSWAFNDDGKYFTGAYKSYFLDEFLLWSQVYSHFFNSNIFGDYPIMERILTSELWESLPNRYHNNYCTSGNTKYAYHGGIMSLLNDENKSYMLKHDDIIETSTLLPFSSFSAPVPTGSDLIRLSYLTYEDYTSIERKDPAWTSHLDSDTTNSFFQVFRGSWEEDSDWLSLITWNINTAGNRDMGHHDQLSFEYYSKGDLLLSDAGEPKHIYDYSIPYPYLHYGEDGVFHNTIMIEDPRNPFDVSDFTNSRSRVFFKGLSKDLVTPASIENLIQTSWMELLEGKVDITTVTGADRATKQSLTSSIDYGRTVLFLDKDYFIIVDRLEGSEPWIYRNVFRPSSLNIVPSTDRNLEDVGHVNGKLTIGDTPYDWLSLPYKTEQTPGINTSSIKWDAYGNGVELHLFSVPSSEIRITKHLTRIGGYSIPSEVFLPIVYFRTNETNDLYRITVLLSRYTIEGEKIPEVIQVTGTGNALKVTSGTVTDLIYAGSGESSFGGLTTDADILHLRESGAQTSAFTFLRGSYVDDEGARKVDVSKTVDYLTLKYNGNNRTFNIKGEGTNADITLYQMNPSITYQVKRDGAIYTNWVMTDGNSKMVITTDLSEHTFEIESTEITSGPKTTTVITPAPNEQGWITATPVTISFFRSDDIGIAYTNYSMAPQEGPWTTVNTSAATGQNAENVTDISEGGFNVTVLGEGTTEIWYYSVDTNTTPNIETTKNVTVRVGTTPPASIANLQNTPGTMWINWMWTNPTDEDFNHTMVYLDGVWKTNTSNPYYNATWLIADTSYEIGTHTVDTYGNVNTTWVNQTAKTVNNSIPRYDVNENGVVDILDNTIVGQRSGETTSPPYPRYDVNEDGTVDILDTTIVGQHFGEIIY